MTEQPVVFECGGDRLLGVVSTPEAGGELGILIVVGGPQYRVGSHRQFVQLARAFAEDGLVAMRFDSRGMGDSEGEWRSFESVEEDVAAALDAMQRTAPGLRRVALWGLCGGASAALLYWLATRDPRVGGLVLVNPWLRTERLEARARVKHYYVKRLLEGAFWRKLLSGGVGTRALGDLFRNLRLAAPARPRAAVQESDDVVLGRRMAEGWAGFPAPILLVLSENDHTAKEFQESAAVDGRWRRNLQMGNVRRFDLSGADHTFTQPAAQAAVVRESIALARSMSVVLAHGRSADRVPEARRA